MWCIVYVTAVHMCVCVCVCVYSGAVGMDVCVLVVTGRSSVTLSTCCCFYTTLFSHESRGARQVHNATHTNQDNSFFKGKRSCLGGTRTHDTPLTRQSALRTELPGQVGL